MKKILASILILTMIIPFAIFSTSASDADIIETVGAQQTLDYGATYTLSASNVTADKYNSETVSKSIFDQKTVWQYNYVEGGASYGSFWLPVSFNIEDYRHRK